MPFRASFATYWHSNHPQAACTVRPRGVSTCRPRVWLPVAEQHASSSNPNCSLWQSAARARADCQPTKAMAARAAEQIVTSAQCSAARGLAQLSGPAASACQHAALHSWVLGASSIHTSRSAAVQASSSFGSTNSEPSPNNSSGSRMAGSKTKSREITAGKQQNQVQSVPKQAAYHDVQTVGFNQQTNTAGARQHALIPGTQQLAQQQEGQQGHQYQQQPQQAGKQPGLWSFRQQLKSLQLQGLNKQSTQPRTYAELRAAASGSTTLLLSLLQSYLPLLVGCNACVAESTPGIISSSSGCSGSSNSSTTNPFSSRQLTQRQRFVMLRQALVCTSWHCERHELLPAEASRLQDMLLRHLLPALVPRLAQTSTRVLARVVYAIGSCHASSWQPQDTSNSNSNYQYIGSQQRADSASAHQFQQPAVMEDPSPAQQGGVQQQPYQSTAVHRSSREWVQQLLPLLPPEQLSAGSLVAAWQGAALHEVMPPDPWLAHASMAAYAALQAGKLDFRGTAALLQACAQLEYSPPAWLMHALVWKLQQQLPKLDPVGLAGVLSALQTLCFRPSNTWLRVWCESSSRLLRGMTISQLAAAAGALSWAGYSAKPWWGKRLVDASQLLLPVATVDEVLTLLDAVQNLHLRPAVSWLHGCYSLLRANSGSLTLSQVADAAHVLAHLRMPAKFTNYHRHWLAACLRSSQLTAVTGLSRAELLYTLYAAGKLCVRLRRTWLQSALQHLHDLLPSASAAELTASFVVMSFFRRQVQQAVMLVWLRDCLAAVVACIEQLSNEGILQLLLACADVGIGVPIEPAAVATAVSAAAASAPVSGASDANNTVHVQQQNAAAAGSISAVDIASGKRNSGIQEQEHSQQEHQQQQQHLQQDLNQLLSAIIDSLVARLSQLSLVEMSRICNSLECRSSQYKVTWYRQLLQHCKAAMAAKL